MKLNIKSFVLLVLLVASTKSFAQSPTADSAILYLTGTFKNYNPQRAFQISMQQATNGNAKAMNAVAMHYTKGIGVDSSFSLAAYWFNQAATNGYTKALVNLGMLHKHQASDSSGYAVVCNYFNQALQAHESSALFAMGYMYYKGLGCTQSYANALQLFNQGIAQNQAPCIYFKGLCFKNGYGLTANNDSAFYYIDSAAKLGYKQAAEELNNLASSSLRSMKQSQNDLIPNTQNPTPDFLSIPKSNTPISINGTYTGNIFQYDYSGKKLLAQIPITLVLHPSPVGEGPGVRLGTLQLNNQIINITATQIGNQLTFSQTSVIARNEAITNQKPNTQHPKATLIFKSLNLQIENNDLTGSLLLFNSYTHETEKPINIKLQKCFDVIASNAAISQSQNNLSLYEK